MEKKYLFRHLKYKGKPCKTLLDCICTGLFSLGSLEIMDYNFDVFGKSYTKKLYDPQTSIIWVMDDGIARAFTLDLVGIANLYEHNTLPGEGN